MKRAVNGCMARLTAEITSSVLQYSRIALADSN